MIYISSQDWTAVSQALYRLSRNSLGLGGLSLWCHITVVISGSGVKLAVSSKNDVVRLKTVFCHHCVSLNANSNTDVRLKTFIVQLSPLARPHIILLYFSFIRC